MRSIRLLGAAILSSAALIAVGVTTEAANAASSRDLNVSYSKVIKYEKFSAFGTLSTHKIRTVKLQYRNHTDDSWTTKSTQQSSLSGNFEFALTTSRSRYYRFYAPPSGGDPAISGYSRKVTVVAQSVTFFAVTPSFQCSNDAGNITMFAHFYPARPYRSVHFATFGVSRQAYQDGKGNAAVNFYPGTADYSFPAVATTDPANGAPAKSSAPFTYSQSFCNF